MVLPEQDLYIQKVIKTFDFKPEDIAFFLKVFDKMDKKKTGFVALSVIFERIHCERNYLTDCLLDLLEIEHGRSSVPMEKCYYNVTLCNVSIDIQYMY